MKTWINKAFEHFIYMELLAHRSYTATDYPIHFWRTKSGLEVDFILGDAQIAIEVKGSDRVDNRDLTPFKAFIKEYSPQKALVICNEKQERVHGPIRIIPYATFLERLWDGKIIT